MEQNTSTTIAAGYACMAANAAMEGRTTEATLYGLIALLYGLHGGSGRPPAAPHADREATADDRASAV